MSFRSFASTSYLFFFCHLNTVPTKLYRYERSRDMGLSFAVNENWCQSVYCCWFGLRCDMHSILHVPFHRIVLIQPFLSIIDAKKIGIYTLDSCALLEKWCSRVLSRPIFFFSCRENGISKGCMHSTNGIRLSAERNCRDADQRSDIERKKG